VFLFFSVARSQELGSWERATPDAAQITTADKPEKPAKPASKAAANASFGMNMPLMSSAFDTSMWLTAA
jgi:hypothetical protein